MEEGREKGLFNFLSILFILVTPFFIFIDKNNFLFEAANLYFLLFFAAVAAVFSILLRLAPSPLSRVSILTILLLLFIDIQFDWMELWGKKVVAIGPALFLILWILRTHAGKILTVVFGTTTAITLGSTLLSHLMQNNISPGSEFNNRNIRLPLYVHIILDEQMGIAGFDNDIPSQNKIRKDIGNLFSNNHFRIFSRAYSPYYDSRDSLTSVMNLRVSDNIDSFYSGMKTPYILLKNSYFEKLLTMDYAINVYQSTYMDFCSSIRKKIQKCVTYNYDGISSAAVTGLTEYEKALIVASTYGKLSKFIEVARIFYQQFRHYLVGRGMILPDWTDWSGTMGPIPALPVFDTLIKDVSTSPRGTMFFAHLLIPHYPYAVDSACDIRRPILMWNNRFLNNHGPDKSNSPRSRLVRYEEYIPQVQCALLKLKELVDTLKRREAFEDAIVIVHGDHGSRIVLVEPRIENKDRLSRQDFYDAFSTLYAVKAPGIAPGYDSRMMTLAELLQNTLSSDINSSTNFESDTRATAFLRSSREPSKNSGLHAVPMPYLPIPNR